MNSYLCYLWRWCLCACLINTKLTLCRFLGHIQGWFVRGHLLVVREFLILYLAHRNNRNSLVKPPWWGVDDFVSTNSLGDKIGQITRSLFFQIYFGCTIDGSKQIFKYLVNVFVGRAIYRIVTSLIFRSGSIFLTSVTSALHWSFHLNLSFQIVARTTLLRLWWRLANSRFKATFLADAYYHE